MSADFGQRSDFWMSKRAELLVPYCKLKALESLKSSFEQTMEENKDYPGLFCMWRGIEPELPLRHMKNNLTMDQYPFGYNLPAFCHG